MDKKVKNDEKKSHIQLPKLLLKRFSNDKGLLAYYDVKKKIIGSNGHPRSLNTELNYYSKYGEEYWNEEVEANLSKLLNALDRIDMDNPSSILPDNFHSLSKKYFHSLLARNPVQHQKANEASIYLQLTDNRYHHDIISSTIFSLAEEQQVLDQWIPTILVNKSTIPFILPMCGFIEYLYMGIHHIAMPIDPYRSILLIPPTARKAYCTEDQIKYGLINESSIIMKLNCFSFEAQIKKNYGYVISGDITILKSAKLAYDQYISEKEEASTLMADK